MTRKIQFDPDCLIQRSAWKGFLRSSPQKWPLGIYDLLRSRTTIRSSSSRSPSEPSPSQERASRLFSCPSRRSWAVCRPGLCELRPNDVLRRSREVMADGIMLCSGKVRLASPKRGEEERIHALLDKCPRTYLEDQRAHPGRKVPPDLPVHRGGPATRDGLLHRHGRRPRRLLRRERGGTLRDGLQDGNPLARVGCGDTDPVRMDTGGLPMGIVGKKAGR